MTLATLSSIVKQGTFVPDDVMKNFQACLNNGAFTQYGKAFGSGRGTRNAIDRFAHGIPAVECGGRAMTNNGNGALMRILPVAVIDSDRVVKNRTLSAAHCTHGHQISDFACIVYASIIQNLINGMDKDYAVEAGILKHWVQVKNVFVLFGYRRLKRIKTVPRGLIFSSGYVVHTLEAALWCFLNTNGYRECILTAVNLGGDANTVAAVAGGFAGIYYKSSITKGIPHEWIEQIPRHTWIAQLCMEHEEKQYDYL